MKQTISVIDQKILVRNNGGGLCMQFINLDNSSSQPPSQDTPTKPIQEAPPNNQIWYTTSDQQIITLQSQLYEGPQPISNVYQNGKGVMTFAEPVTDITEMFDNSYWDWNTYETTQLNIYSNLLSVTLPNGITKIGDYAFAYCNNLTSVIIPESVTIISESFIDCDALRNITCNAKTAPEIINLVWWSSFQGLPENGILIIPENSKGYSTWLDALPNGWHNPNIKVTITFKNWDDSIISKTQYSFGQNINTPDNPIRDGYTFIKWDNAIQLKATENATYKPIYAKNDPSYIYYTSINNQIINFNFNNIQPISNTYENNQGVLTLPINIISINEAFEQQLNLKTIIIPDCVTEIGDDAFWGCSNLTSIIIPNSVTNIGITAFEYCDNLTSINYNGTKAQWNSIDKSKKWDADPYKTIEVIHCTDGDITLLVNIDTIDIPDVSDIPANNKIYYKTLDENAVELSEYCVGEQPISNVYQNGKGIMTFEHSLIDITEEAFYNDGTLNNLLSITMPDSITTIGTRAFSGCCNLVSIHISNNANSIEIQAFRGCVNLQSITIPASVKTLKTEVFFYCRNLKTINYTGTKAQWNSIQKYSSWDGSDPDYNIETAIEVIHCTDGDIKYKITSDEILSLPEDHKIYYTTIDKHTVTVNIDGILLNEYKNETGVIVCDSIIQYIPIQCMTAFRLYSVILPNSVTSINEEAFYDCENLTSITIPDSVTNIGSRAFFNCLSLTSITIPNNVTCISNELFSQCSNLTSIIIGDSVTSIGDEAFWGCSSLSSIIIPDNVISIGNEAFAYCDNLTSITIPVSVKQIGMWVFVGCDTLKSINYTGTKAQWNSILKEYYWDGSYPEFDIESAIEVIHCTDGDITL